MHHNRLLQTAQLSLNPEQQSAVIPHKGVFLVCAGAGSGKTRVITARMLHLMTVHNVPPSEIVALTFTNKAALEMKERIITHSDMLAEIPNVGTFHSFCLRILKNNMSLLGLYDFAILDDDDQEKLIRSLLNRHGLNKKITPKHLISMISHIKNESITGTVDFSSINELTVRELCILYEREKKVAHCFDFDDLLLETLKAFRTNDTFKRLFQSRVRHMLVDEYQDTNHVQHALLKAMTLDATNVFALDSLCVVGDEDQAIYSWRGATVTNIINFNRDFPTTTRFTIEQNYRSVQAILNVANTIIKNNTQRMPKELWSHRKGNDCVRLLTCASGYQEGEVVALFTKLHQATLLSQQDNPSLAVLYRSHYQSRTIEEALIRHSMPYTIIGGIRFYERQEIKDLFAYARLIANPYDRISFMRIINVPARGLGDKFQEQFLTLWDQHPQQTFIDIATLIQDALPSSKQAALQSFIDCFTDLHSNDNAHDIVASLIKRIGYLVYLDNTFEQEEALTKKENVKELLHAIRGLEERNIISLKAFLDEVSLLQDTIADQAQEKKGIRLMTLHAAKGLEFDTVLLTGLEEGILPSNHNLYDPAAIEEERRLLYVGITRAKERLLLTHAHYRYTYGSMTDQLPSRFIKEMNKEQIQHHDGSVLDANHLKIYLNDWLSGTSSRTTVLPTHHNKPPLQQPQTLYAAEARWYLKQKVRHKLFGIGIIERIDAKEDGQTVHLTVAFNATTKKVDASFLEPTS